MLSAYYRLEKSLHIPNAWAVSIPTGIAKLVLGCKVVRRAVAKVFVDQARDRVYLVLWVGVDPRWIARTIFRVLEANGVDAGHPTQPAAIPSTQHKPAALRRREPKMLPTGALAC